MNLHIIHELDGNQDAGDEKAVNVEGVDRQQWLPAREAVEVNVGHHEAGMAAVCVLEDPLQVAFNGDGRPG